MNEYLDYLAYFVLVAFYLFVIFPLFVTGEARYIEAVKVSLVANFFIIAACAAGLFVFWAFSRVIQ